MDRRFASGAGRWPSPRPSPGLRRHRRLPSRTLPFAACRGRSPSPPCGPLAPRGRDPEPLARRPSPSPGRRASRPSVIDRPSAVRASRAPSATFGPVARCRVSSVRIRSATCASTPAPKGIGERRPAAPSCSILVVSHHLDGLLRAGSAGLLHPAAGCGVRRVSARSERGVWTLRLGRSCPRDASRTLRRLTSPKAAPRHRGRCPLGVGRSHATPRRCEQAAVRSEERWDLPGGGRAASIPPRATPSGEETTCGALRAAHRGGPEGPPAGPDPRAGDRRTNPAPEREGGRPEPAGSPHGALGGAPRPFHRREPVLALRTERPCGTRRPRGAEAPPAGPEGGAPRTVRRGRGPDLRPIRGPGAFLRHAEGLRAGGDRQGGSKRAEAPSAAPGAASPPANGQV